MIKVSSHNIPNLSFTQYKAEHFTSSYTNPIHQAKYRMEHLASREDHHFRNQSFNQPNPLHNFIDKPSIIRAQLTPKPPKRDTSFSTLHKPDDTLLSTEANHHGHRAQDPEISIFEAEKYFNGAHEPKSKNTNGVYTISNPKQPDTHIPAIGRLSLSTPKQSVSSVSRLSSVSDDSYGRNYRARSFHATPTASSEASWNSQTGLLTNPPGLAPVSIRNLPSTAERSSKKSGASMNWFLRGNICPCSGKKSVNVKQSGSESETSKIPPTPPRIVQLNRISSSGGSGGYLYSSSQSSPNATRATLIPEQSMSSFVARPQLDQSKLSMTSTNSNLHREQSFPPIRVAAGGTGNGFTFPILSNKADPSKRSLSNVQPPFLVADGAVSAGETPRDSIEVFQPRESPKSRRASYDDDICSDASSDLFEIESFSTTPGTQTTLFPRRDSLDDPAANFNVRRLRIAAINKSAVSSAGITIEDVEEPVTPSIAPTECYAPSEVSVDWSVTTAEGFDRASFAAFSVSATELGYAALRQPTKGSSGADETKRKGNGGLLTSCICEKAVNVGPSPIKYQTETRPATTQQRSHVNGRPQAPNRVNGASSTDNNASQSHGIARSTLMPAPFVPESMAHRHSL